DHRTRAGRGTRVPRPSSFTVDGAPNRWYGRDQSPPVRRRCGGWIPPGSPTGVGLDASPSGEDLGSLRSGVPASQSLASAAAHLQGPALIMHVWTTSFPWYPPL